MENTILIGAHIHSDIDTVWDAYINPEHIKNWNSASPDWHCPEASSDFRVGGEFHSTMAARDGSMSFDFWGTYTEIVPHELICYTMGDGRKAEVEFQSDEHCVNVLVEFEPEGENSVELQQQGWQAILDNFADYVMGLDSDEEHHHGHKH